MRTFLTLALVAALFGCKTKPASSNNKCQTVGTVVDYDGLDGCGYLIKLQDGKLLNPIKFPDGFQAHHEQSIRFNYKVLKNMASICMAENEIVEITCIEDGNGASGPVECSEISNPFAIPWMNKAIDRHNPVKIIKLQMGGKWTFAFQAEPNDTFLYDCDGKLLCQSNGDENDDCHRQYLNFISKGKTIWKGEGVWD